jgi:hypothetical protein
MKQPTVKTTDCLHQLSKQPTPFKHNHRQPDSSFAVVPSHFVVVLDMGLPQFYSTLLYIIFTVSYGALKQAKHEQINVLRPVSEQTLFQNKFLFLFCPLLKYFSSPILLSEQIVRK